MFKKFKSIIIDEKNVTKVLSVINGEHAHAINVRVGNCGWADEPTAWFVHFESTNIRFKRILNALTKIGEVKYKDNRIYFE